jgi:cytochrome c oxidase subunit 2
MAAAVMAGGLVAGCGSSSTSTTSSDPQLDLGRAVYARSCASCHGPKGGGSIGTRLAGGAVVERYPDFAAQRAVIANGKGAMPKWSGVLSDEEIDAVVRFTREAL